MQSSTIEPTALYSRGLQCHALLQGEGWQPTGVRAGCVGLLAQGGTATVEASWVPTIAGSLPVPEIHLRDVSHQEVFDAGSNNEFIQILSAQ